MKKEGVDLCVDYNGRSRRGSRILGREEKIEIRRK